MDKVKEQVYFPVSFLEEARQLLCSGTALHLQLYYVGVNPTEGLSLSGKYAK